MGKKDMHTKYWFSISLKRDNLGEQDIGLRIILKWVLRDVDCEYVNPSLAEVFCDDGEDPLGYITESLKPSMPHSI